MKNTESLAVIELGNPKLRQVAEVIFINNDSPTSPLLDPQMQTLIDGLLLTVQQSNGGGGLLHHKWASQFDY